MTEAEQLAVLDVAIVHLVRPRKPLPMPPEWWKPASSLAEAQGRLNEWQNRIYRTAGLIASHVGEVKGGSQ